MRAMPAQHMPGVWLADSGSERICMSRCTRAFLLLIYVLWCGRGEQRAHRKRWRACAHTHMHVHVRFKCGRALLACVIRAQRRGVAGADDDGDDGGDDDEGDRGSAMTIDAPGVNPHVITRSRSHEGTCSVSDGDLVISEAFRFHDININPNCVCFL